MFDMSLLWEAIIIVFSPANLFFCMLGMILGVFFGALPGISASMGVVLMLPFTYYMGIIPSCILLCSLYVGASYGGSITAILFNTPGTPEACATSFDGYPMAQQGKAGRALGLAMSGSAIGSIFSVFCMLFISPLLSQVALKIQSAEYFALTILGIACIAAVGSKSIIKALITGLIGIIIALIGMDPMTGASRMTFDNLNLLGGVEFIPVMIGAFAMAEVLKQIIERHEAVRIDGKDNVAVESLTLKEFFVYKTTILKSAIIGTLIGILPGTGGSIASIVSYGEAVRSAKDKSRFGKGAEEGVIAPETANNAAAGGAMVPTLVLGIPGSPTTAIILAAFVLQGLQPGPQLMKEQPLMLYSIFLSMLIASVVIFFVARVAVKGFAQVLKLPYSILAPIIVMFSVIGSYAVSNDMGEVWMMLGFGFFGYFMKKYDFSPATLILGLVLGRMMEENFRRQLLLTEGDYSTFITRPVSILIWVFMAVIVFYPMLAQYLKDRKMKKAVTTEE